MKNNKSYLIALMFALFSMMGFYGKTFATEEAKNKEIVDQKCYTNGVHTGWYNTCSPGFSRCSPTNCTPAN